MTTTTNTAATTTNTAINSNPKNGNQDSGLYFIDVARQYSSPVGGETELEPTELNTVKSSGGFLVVSTDKLRVKYTNVNLHGHDVGVIQGDRPAPDKRLVYYFEIYVKNAGAKGQIAIGFTNHSFKMRRQPGWEANSCGSHGDDGNLYHGSGTGEAFGPTFTTNDTAGAGINNASQEFFFTKNGAVVGAVYKDIKGLLLPTVAVHSQNEEIEVNFGKKPFAFDLKLIRNGEIDSALSKLHEWYPQIVQDEKSATCFLLHSQKFIELVRAGALEEAVHYGRVELAKFFKLSGFDDLVRDCAALLAYEQPHQCSAGYLLEESHREIVADAVNGMILLTDPNVKDAQSCLRSHLERLLRQLTVCCLERRSLNGDQGEGFHLHGALNTSTAGKGPSANMYKS